MGVLVRGALAVPHVLWPLEEGGLRSPLPSRGSPAGLGGWGLGSGKSSATGSRLWER